MFISIYLKSSNILYLEAL